MGRHRRQNHRPGSAHPGRLILTHQAGVVAVLTAGALLGGGGAAVAQSAGAANGCCGTRDGGDDPPPPSHGDNHGLVIIDNSNADSWLEVDRTLNTLVGSKGTAGSDHDGDGGDILTGVTARGPVSTLASVGSHRDAEGDE